MSKTGLSADITLRELMQLEPGDVLQSGMDNTILCELALTTDQPPVLTSSIYSDDLLAAVKAGKQIVFKIYDDNFELVLFSQNYAYYEREGEETYFYVTFIIGFYDTSALTVEMFQIGSESVNGNIGSIQLQS